MKPCPVAGALLGPVLRVSVRPAVRLTAPGGADHVLVHRRRHGCRAEDVGMPTEKRALAP